MATEVAGDPNQALKRGHQLNRCVEELTVDVEEHGIECLGEPPPRTL